MQKVLGNVEKGLLFVVSAPAGTGKTTLVQMLMQEFDCVVESVSYTTRKPRESETHGYHYNFISVGEFEEKIQEGEFLEYAKIYNDYYGTSRNWVEAQRGKGKHVVLVIDTQGAEKLREKGEAVFIFIQPPSIEELRNRLKKRKTESDSVIEKRLEWAKREIEAGHKYDYQIVNEELATAYEVLKSILIAEEHRIYKK